MDSAAVASVAQVAQVAQVPAVPSIPSLQTVLKDRCSRLYKAGLSTEVVETLQSEGLRNKESLLYTLGLRGYSDHRLWLSIPKSEEVLWNRYPSLYRLLSDFLGQGEEVALIEGVVITSTGRMRVGRWLRKSLLTKSTYLDTVDLVEAYREVTGEEYPGDIEVSSREEIVKVLERKFLPALGHLAVHKDSYVLISWNVWDIIACSTGTGFTSCYCVGGAHFAGVSSYAVDSHTLVVYFVSGGKRKGRVFVHFPSDLGCFIVSRVYGCFPEVALQSAIKFLQSRLDYKSTWVQELLIESSTRQVFQEVTPGKFGGYFDPEVEHSGAVLCYRKKARPFEVKIGLAPSRCLGCGSDYYVAADGICPDCRRERYHEVECSQCDEPVNEVFAYLVDGQYYCEGCFDLRR